MSASSMASSLPRITRRMAPCNWEIREEVAVVMVMAALSLTRPRAFATNDVHKRSASAAHLVMLPGPWAISSVVRAPASHAGGQRFKSFIAHHQAFSFCPKCAQQRVADDAENGGIVGFGAPAGEDNFGGTSAD